MYPDLSNYQGTVDPAAFRKRLEASGAPAAGVPMPSQPSVSPVSAPAMAPSAPASNNVPTPPQMTYGMQAPAAYNSSTPAPAPPQNAGIGQKGPNATYTPGVGTTVPGLGIIPDGTHQINVPTPGIPQGLPTPMTPQQIQDEAKARIDKLLSQKNQAATQQKQSLQTEFDRQQSLNKDNRTLQDAQFDRQNNPFSGGTDYRRAMLDRERGITDRQAQEDLSNRLGNIDSALADFQNLSEEQRQSIINDLTTQERGYGLQLAQMLQSQSNSDRNFGLQQQQVNQAQSNADRTFTANQQAAAAKQAADLRQSHIDLAQFLTQQTGKLVYPTDDPMEAYAQVADVSTLAAQKLAADAKQMSFDQVIKQALAENTINQTQANIMLQAQQQAETAGYHQQSLAISKQNADTSATNAQTSAANAKTAELYKQWEATGNAPAGIPGVEPGTPLYDQVGSRQDQHPAKVDAKTSTNNLSEAKDIIKGKNGITKEQARTYATSPDVANQLSDADYRSLMNWIDSTY